MRAIMGAVLICSAALLVAAAGCTGAGQKPQAGKAMGKTEQQAVAKASRPPPGTEQRSPKSVPDRDHKPLAIDGDNPPAGETAEMAPARDTGAKQVTVLRAPTVVPATMPEVVLSAAHADDCLIRVGDTFPEFRLPDLMGRMQSLGELQGDSMTVVVLWSGDRLLAADQLRYLNEHISRYADLGVKAIAINVGQSPERVRTTAEALKLAVPVLLDLNRGLFSRVGKAHLPRTYLLDRDGSVLWLDIEFSRHTRDGLEQAIHASLQST